MSGARAPESTRTQSRISRAEDQLAVAQQITHIGSWEWDLATSAITWSDELYRIYGLEPRSREITIDFFVSSLHEADRPAIQRAVQEAIARGGRFEWRERIVRADGSVRVLDTVGEVISAGAAAQGLIGTCRDVTDDLEREQELDRYADIVKNIQIGIAVWSVENPDDVDTIRLVAFNPSAERLARRGLRTDLKRTFREVMPAGAPSFEAIIRQVARDGKVRETAVLSSRSANDPNRAVAMKGFPLPGGCVGVAIEDITAQTIARRLQSAEQRVLEMLAEGAPLEDLLATLVRAVEAHSPPVIGAIHLRDGDGGRYPGRVAPSLTEPEESLFVYAVAPILGSDERDLGDFVLYVRQERAQSEGDAAVLERAAHVARIAVERRHLEDQLRALSAHVESVREEERTAIAREIHDEFGQVLTALKMDIAWLARRTVSESISAPREALVKKLEAMSAMADDAIKQVRRIASGLRPGVLDDLGLVAAIEWQAQEFEARTGTACTVVSNVDDARIDGALATAAFRIFQEALTNVTRHAEATRVDVRLHITPTSLELDVRDDGKGITPEALRSRKSLGLLGVRERAHRLGGSATITSGEPSGTLVALRVPLEGAS